MEEWRAIPTYEGIYEISNDGQIRRINTSPGARPHMMKPYTKVGIRTNYLGIYLFKNGVKRRYQVHHLVVWAFDQQVPHHLQVNHKNGNGLDNRVENLEIVTASYNQWHCNHIIKTRTPQQGSKHGRSKLTEELVLEIRERSAGGQKGRHIAQALHVSEGTVSMILSRRIWRHI